MKPDLPDVRKTANSVSAGHSAVALQAAADLITAQRKNMSAVNRQVANVTWGDKSLSPQERQMFVDFARSIGLNAALGHIELMGGKPYITHKGLLHKLNESEFNWSIDGGIVGEDSPDYAFWAEKPGARVWRATITGTSRKDPTHTVGPYTDFGVAHASEFANKGKITAPQMAKKRAEHRAIRAVLAIDIPTVDEMMAEQFVHVTATDAPTPEEQYVDRRGEPDVPKGSAVDVLEDLLGLAASARIGLDQILVVAADVAKRPVPDLPALRAQEPATIQAVLDRLRAKIETLDERKGLADG